MHVVYFVCFNGLWKEIQPKGPVVGGSLHRRPVDPAYRQENQNLAPLVERRVIGPQISE
jgi:hypothetical protein